MVTQMVKNLPTMWETCVQSLDQEDPLEKVMFFPASFLAWRIPWARGDWRVTVHGIAKSQIQLID